MRKDYRRRLLLASSALLVAPLACLAQQPTKVWRVGYLHLRSGPSERDEAFLTELRGLGYVEGRNLKMENRWTAGSTKSLQELANELVRLRVDAIVTSSTLATEAAKRATSTIPIVMAAVANPVASGLIESLARPGGNVTGLSQLVDELGGKRLELLHALLPKANRIAVLASSITPSDTQRRIEILRTAANAMGVQLVVEYAKEAEDLQRALAAMQRERVQALIVQGSPITLDNRKLLAQLLTRQRLPAIFEVREYVGAGGLMSYGYNVIEMYRRAAILLDKIFNGAKPADLPVEQPNKFELVINMRAARALGLAMPQEMLLRADEVIQ